MTLARGKTPPLDPTAAGHALVAILAALHVRERTGRGQFIDMAQGEATIQRIAEPVMDYLLNGRVAGTQGNRYPGIAPHGVYRCAGDDEWVAIVARDGEEWDALKAAAAPALDDPRFATLAGRLEHQDALDEAIEGWTLGHDRFEVAEALQAAGVPAHAVMDPPSLAADENLAALRAAHLQFGDGIPFVPSDLLQGIVWKLTATPGMVRSPGKPMGTDNAEVLRELAGVDNSELARLREAGVVGA